MLAELADALAGGPLGAVLLMVIGTASPIPSEPPALLIATRHPLGIAFGLIWSGAMVGAAAVHAVAAAAGHRIGVLGRWQAVDRTRARLCAAGWLGILALRLTPIVPFLAVSLAAGLMRLPPGGCLLGTGLGIVPGCLAMALIGRGLMDESWGTTLLGLGLVLGIVRLVVALRRGGRPGPLAEPPKSP